MEFIIKEIEKNFLIAQVIAALLGLSAIGLWLCRPDLLLLAEALGCFTAAYLLTVRMYYGNQLGALDQAFEALRRTGAKTIPVFSGYRPQSRNSSVSGRPMLASVAPFGPAEQNGQNAKVKSKQAALRPVLGGALFIS